MFLPSLTAKVRQSYGLPPVNNYANKLFSTTAIYESNNNWKIKKNDQTMELLLLEIANPSEIGFTSIP